MMENSHEIYSDRESYSKQRLEELRKKILNINEIGQSLKGLTIFCAGSYARYEASEYSDIDMFFLCESPKDKQVSPHTAALRLFGKMIEIINELKYPEFSNDCQYLKILHSEDILKNLGSPTDDHENYFTVRMLLLLESQCLYGESSCDAIIKNMIDSYFSDFPDHATTFQPIFLLNDICRYWKTLLLNYENKRNTFPNEQNSEELKKKQKVRNFKLKYSRMTTCFATIAAIGSYESPTQDDIFSLTKLTPRMRLEFVKMKFPDLADEVNNVLERYAWFLEKTGHDTQHLEQHFNDKSNKAAMFAKANEYGDAMFKLISKIDDRNNNLQLLRYLVI